MYSMPPNYQAGKIRLYVQTAVADVIANSFNPLPDLVVFYYFQCDRVENVILLQDMLFHRWAQIFGNGGQADLELIKMCLIESPYEFHKVADCDFYVYMVAVCGSAKTGPAVLLQIWKDDVLFGFDVFFHGVQMLGDVGKFSEFRTCAGYGVFVCDNIYDILQVSQETANHIMFCEHLANNVTIGQLDAEVDFLALDYPHHHKGRG